MEQLHYFQNSIQNNLVYLQMDKVEREKRGKCFCFNLQYLCVTCTRWYSYSTCMSSSQALLPGTMPLP